MAMTLSRDAAGVKQPAGSWMNATGVCNWDPTGAIPPGVITFNPLFPGQVSSLLVGIIK
jgi:hypothetical protein